ARQVPRATGTAGAVGVLGEEGADADEAVPSTRAAAAEEASGATTPSVTIIFIASSMLMSSSMACERGTMRMKPEVGLGVVGMKTDIGGSLRCAPSQGTSAAV